MEEELTMEALLLKNEEGEGVFLLPTFPLIVTLWPTPFSGHGALLLVCLSTSQASYSNKSLLTYNCLSLNSSCAET